jgi:hypothetical protein
VSHRAAIFELRAQVGPDGKPMSYGKIAAARGVSKSRVEMVLKRPGNVPIHDAGGDLGNGQYSPPPGAPADPEQQALNQDRIALQRARLRADRLEQDRRAALLENPGQGGSGTMLLLLDGQLQQLRAEITRLAARAPAAPAPPPPPPAPSLAAQLSDFRAVSETVQAFAPSRPASSALELELETARAHLAIEERERMRRLDIDERERMERAAGERARGEAIARLIEGTGPLLAAALQKWLEGTPAASGAAAPGAAPPALLPVPGGGTMPAPGTVSGPCPNCGAQLQLSPEPGKVDRCPRCELALAVVNGEIQPRIAPDLRKGYAS